ncbi:ionotropic receptor 21a-like isoform X2 [Prorops nasuta]|uniref:ionotropic receptor 21a-like isoform X2 n=1 Tax=Prorops nasuta TaxID=863751 RepID=UPI0034CF78D0
MLIIFLILLVSRCDSFNKTGGLYLEQQCQSANNLMTLIRIIIDEMAQGSKCMVYITDNFYHRFLQKISFESPLSPPKYEIVLRDNDDFSPARVRLQMHLERSKSSSCNSYIILIANGLQASRFLEYVEGERLINTRGLFLFLHDQRLLRPQMKYIWQRIINVIFIRHYNSYKNRSGQKSSTEPIHLETVHFPPHKGKLLVTKYVDTWYHNKFIFNNQHFPEKTGDLQNKTFRVAVFTHIPAVTEESKKYCNRNSNLSNNTKALGVEFELMRIISKMKNFKADYYSPPDIETERWGTKMENQTFTGLLGEAVNKNAVFFLGDLHYTNYHLKLIDLSIPYNTECLTFLTPVSLTENSWKLLILPFRLYTWIALLCTLFIGGSAMHLFSLFYKNFISFQDCSVRSNQETVRYDKKLEMESSAEKQERMKGLYLFAEPQNSILYTYSMLLQVSVPTLPNAWAVRIFIGWWWIYSILVAVAYRASMTAALANPIGKITIDNLAQLVRSPISVGGWSPESKNFFLTSSDSDSQKIGKKFEITQNEEDAIERVANGTLCYYENVYLLRNARVKRQVLEQEQEKNNTEELDYLSRRNLHIMEECVVTMPVSIGMEKNSPLKPYVDIWVRRMIEAGLVQKWLSDVMEWSKITEIRQESAPEKALINLHKLHGALVALGIGYFISFLAFITEILHWKYLVLKHPQYDKYRLDEFYKSVKLFKKY